MIGRTLSRYLAGRFLEQILIVFLTISALAFLIDFVELLRRTNDAPRATTGYVAVMAFMRAPIASEQALPFAVLFGAMAAFVNLSRRMELVVVRAAGVSVWGFLTPGLILAVLLGLFSAMLFNPFAADLKQRADAMEIDLFGHAGGSKDKNAQVWLRQRSIDGRATIRATRILDRGMALENVMVYLEDDNGRFLERVEAPRARLTEGAWMLQDATIIRPGEENEQSSRYALATDMTPEEVMRDKNSVDSISFWDLSEFRAKAEDAGLDTIPFDLRFQSLLAQPLLLVAMVLIGAAFSLRFFRFGGIGRMIGSGVAAGFMLYVATRMVGDMGSSGLLNPIMAAWSPALVGSLMGVFALLNQEDG